MVGIQPLFALLEPIVLLPFFICHERIVVSVVLQQPTPKKAGAQKSRITMMIVSEWFCVRRAFRISFVFCLGCAVISYVVHFSVFSGGNEGHPA